MTTAISSNKFMQIANPMNQFTCTGIAHIEINQIWEQLHAEIMSSTKTNVKVLFNHIKKKKATKTNMVEAK